MPFFMVFYYHQRSLKNSYLYHMTNNRFIITLWLCLMFFLFASCGSKKQAVVLPADFKGPKELSRLYGVKITPNDNIYLYNEGSRWLGVPHRLGGNTKKGVDCSGFVAIIYREVYGKQLARSSADMLKHNVKKVGRSRLQEGDLVFFRTDGSRKKTPNHVGIYLKNGRFIHTSTSRGVMVSSLSEPYFTRSFITGGRVK
ncbi:lipoprotein Spr [Parabacteroides sp. PF5-6]|nr:lipoprotein Spr [Parabacteroides sp. PF5-6]